MKAKCTLCNFTFDYSKVTLNWTDCDCPEPDTLSMKKMGGYFIDGIQQCKFLGVWDDERIEQIDNGNLTKGEIA